MICNACCCCAQKKTNEEIETIPGDKNITSNRSFKSGYKDEPVFVIDIEPKRNQQPIAIQSINFEKECLDEHNKYRANHGCPPLTLNKELCNFAKEWAQYLAKSKKFEHRLNSKYGENIYMSSTRTINGKDPVVYWYYRYGGQISYKSYSDYFTQIIWKKSKKLGVGYAHRGSSTIVVCNYDPPGNCVGEFLENVPSYTESIS